MNIFDSIYNKYKAFRDKVVIRDTRDTSYYCNWQEKRLDYARVIFRNIVELLTDLANDVEWINAGGNSMMFANFVKFFNTEGKIILNRLYRFGFVVIGYKNGRGFFLMYKNIDYLEVSRDDKSIVEPLDKFVSVYVMRSSAYKEEAVSDLQICQPFLSFLNDVLNASATISRRLGVVVVASPKNLSSAPTQAVLRKEDKKEIESDLSKEYGALRNQSQIMVLPREMSFNTINLAGLDVKTEEKARMAILAIADRIKVPSNQIAIIDANSSKSLANGSELREGDFNKYQSFERLLNETFVDMAKAIGLNVTYTIYNKPVRPTTGVN